MDKPLQIAFKNLESSEFVERSIRERAAKLERFHQHIIGCRVVVSVPHRTPESGKTPLCISIEVDIPGRPTIVTKEQEERHDAKGDPTMAVNRAFDAMQRQLESISKIRRGEVKAHAGEAETGQVVRLFPEQNYGFVEVRGAGDLYFTRNAVVGGTFEDLDVGTIVHITRATTEGPMGPQASSVRVLGAERSLG